MVALGRWGAPLMVESGENDAFRSHWLALPATLFLTDRAPDRPPIAIELRTGEEPVVIETIDGAVRTRSGSAEHPDLVVSGTPQVVLGLLSGMLSLSEARARAGVRRRPRGPRPRASPHPRSRTLGPRFEVGPAVTRSAGAFRARALRPGSRLSRSGNGKRR
jgi:hypothetical protein